MTRNWIAVASAEHVRRGRGWGIMQVCHGRVAPLRRINPGDRVIYYSPTETFRARDGLKSFTAIGIVQAGDPYQVDMGDDGTGGRFCPFRRDVAWLHAKPAAIEPLLASLAFTAGKPNWGYQLRFGLFEINDHDLALIASAMVAQLPGAASPVPRANPKRGHARTAHL